MTQTPVVSLQKVHQQFGSTTILSGLSLDIAPGEFVALLGRSGSGKTTLLRLLSGLDTPSQGHLRLPERRAVVFQEPRLLPWKNVWRNVVLGVKDRPTRDHAVEALREVELAHRADAWPLTLSGGEAQRAGLARALVRSPELLLLDEPFAALDALTRLRMQSLVARLWEVHRTAVLLVTHDVDEALLLADRVVVLEHGRIAAERTISIPRPRRPGDAAFASLRLELLGLLGVKEALAAA
ncbi:Alkanesulfonates transport ATP-binding protein [Granulibacter bethesdensis]|uniref:ABC transporter ATP-binding protein n=1 Tax=Granulibacter bethesdensis TaxID=364410 RepID=UPI00090A0DEE|nr:ABC transporter ATP-binding protein [Granulibacter bethesdensis]APH56340.1 Alkanesulfonates transport ATP-binding protein [Granulibacter bethesdensis]